MDSPELLAPAGAAARMDTRAIVAAIAAGVILWQLAWHADTVWSIVAIWNSSDTFAHGYLILPISLWLIWLRRHELASVEIRPCYAALAPLAVTGFVWFFAGLASVGVVQHYAIALMPALVVLAVLGVQVTRALAFPLLFLLFAVPFGEFIEPLLMEHTADFTVAALRLTGIPVYREGQFFTIPTGNWSVVEACSGLRFLIASVTVGVLFAYLTYRSPARRALFIAASIVVPIVANWARAYMIVMIGHLSGMKYAVGADHLVYGWVLFGIVMLILFWIGSFWREDEAPAAPAADTATAPGPRPRLAPIAGVAAAVAVLTAAWPLAAHRLGTGELSPPDLQAPAGREGWTAAGRDPLGFSPNFLGARTTVGQAYARSEARAGIHLSYYRDQRPGAQMISVRNTLVTTDGRPWRNTRDPVAGSVAIGDVQIPVVESQIAGASGKLLVWHWYWIDGEKSSSTYWVKFRQALAVLMGHGDDGAVVVLYVPYMEEGRQDAARKVLREFAGAMLPAISASLENARRSGSAK